MNTFLIRSRPLWVILCLLAVALWCPAGAPADILVANGTDILKLNDDGTGSSTYISGATYGLYYDTTSHYIYYTGPSNSIRRANRDGSGVTTLVSNAGDVVVDIVVDHTNSKIIWSDLNNAKIRRANLDGSSVEDLVVGVSFPHGLAIDEGSGYLYWAGPSEIGRVNLDGTGLTSVLFDPDGGQLAFFFINSGKIYWSNYDVGKVKRANLDGSSIEVLASGSDATGAEGLALNTATNEIFYLGHTTGGVGLRRMSLTGTGGSVIEGSTRGFDIVTGFTSADPTPTPTATATPTATGTPPPFPTAQNGNTSIVIAVAPRSSISGGIGRIIRTDATGKQAVLISASDSRASSPSALAYSESRQRIYWANGSGAIYSMTPGGADIQSVFTASAAVKGMIIDDTNSLLYFATCGSSCEVRVTSLLDTSTSTLLASGYTRLAGGLILRGEDLIWGDVPHLSYVTRRADGSYTTASVYVDFGYNFYSLASWGSRIVVGNNGIFALSGVKGEKKYTKIAAYGYGAFYSHVITALTTKKLDTSLFDVPLVFYAGGPGGVVKITPPDDLGALLLTLGIAVDVTSILEINVQGGSLSAATPTPTPTPLPNGKNRIVGKVLDPSTQTNSTYLIAPPRGGPVPFNGPQTVKTASVENIPVYIKPISNSTAGGTEVESQRTLTDANGEYLFVDMPAGDYKLTFDRADLGFLSDSLTVSTDEFPPDMLVSAATPAKKGCKFKNLVKKVSNFETKAETLINYVLSTAQTLKGLAATELSADQQSALQVKLDAATAKARASYARLLLLTQALPEVSLNCTVKAGCKEKDYSSKVAGLAKQVTAIGTNGLALVKAAEGYLALTDRTRFQPTRRMVNKLTVSAGSVTALPMTSYSCK